ncbi:MAG: RodZ domain-containing protein [Thermoanaerobaculia bacterium]
MPDQDAQPHSELASFGEELRREREIRGISLKEIADATKISKRFLDAIERNDHKTLPAPVFTRGFVREYARYLGLSSEEMVNRYNYAAAGDDRIEQSPHLERLAHPPAATVDPLDRPRKGIPPPYARIDRNIYVLLAIVVALIGISTWALRHRREARNDAEPVRAERTAPLKKPLVPAAPVANAPATPANVMRLTVEAIGSSWVVLDADGKNVLNEEVRKGYHNVLEARDSFHFRTIGNAAGLALTLNEIRIPALGQNGEVLHDRTFDRAWLEQQPESRNHP